MDEGRGYRCPWVIPDCSSVRSSMLRLSCQSHGGDRILEGMVKHTTGNRESKAHQFNAKLCDMYRPGINPRTSLSTLGNHVFISQHHMKFKFKKSDACIQRSEPTTHKRLSVTLLWLDIQISNVSSTVVIIDQRVMYVLKVPCQRLPTTTCTRLCSPDHQGDTKNEFL